MRLAFLCWLLLSFLSPPLASAPSSAYDTFTLWTGGTQLRGANVYQRIVYPGGYDDPLAWGNGPLGPVFGQKDFDALSAAGANLVVLSHPGLFVGHFGELHPCIEACMEDLFDDPVGCLLV